MGLQAKSYVRVWGLGFNDGFPYHPPTLPPVGLQLDSLGLLIRGGPRAVDGEAPDAPPKAYPRPPKTSTLNDEP